MLRFNTTGNAVYGRISVSVDGSEPAALSGLTVGLPAWRDDDSIVYRDVSGGLTEIHQLDLPATITTESTDGVTRLCAGGDLWAAYWATDGSVRVSAAFGPFAGAYLGDVSRDGRVVLIDSLAAKGGLTVYDSVGATVLALPDATVGDVNAIRLVGDVLAWVDLNGKWNLIDVTDGSTPDWVPQAQAVSALIPLTHAGTLYLLEKTPAQLTLRPATRSLAWVLEDSPSAFSPDGIDFPATGFRCGACSSITEPAASLITYDVTFIAGDNVSVSRGTVSGGSVVYAPDVDVPPSEVIVGPPAGNTLAAQVKIPEVNTQSLTSKDGKITQPWLYAWNKLNQSVSQIGGIVQNTPVPVAGSGGFVAVAADGQQTLVASPGEDTLTFTSENESVAITTDPVTQTVDLSGFGYVPMTTGAIPGEILFVGPDVMLMKVPVV